jgi:hypothetical protein
MPSPSSRMNARPPSPYASSSAPASAPAPSSPLASSSNPNAATMVRVGVNPFWRRVSRAILYGQRRQPRVQPNGGGESQDPNEPILVVGAAATPNAVAYTSEMRVR